MGRSTTPLMSASIMFNAMEPVYLCRQGHNNPGSRMSTYVDVSSNQNVTSSTRPSSRKVNSILTSIEEKIAITGDKAQFMELPQETQELMLLFLYL